MQKKRSEASLGGMMRKIGYLADKARDRGYPRCPHCHKEIKECPHCEEDTLMPKAKTRPDYLVALEWAFVECKQGIESWPLNDVSFDQERILDENEGTKGSSWIFLELGGGKAPFGRGAWLIPWNIFKRIRSECYQKKKMSVRFVSTQNSRMPVADELFSPYRIKWEDGNWKIPKQHIWWDREDK